MLYPYKYPIHKVNELGTLSIKQLQKNVINMSNFPSKKGRPKGSANKNTEVVRNSFRYLIENNLERIQHDLDMMSEVDRVKCLISLSKFVLPQLQSVDITNDNSDFFKPIQIHFSDADK